VLRQMHRSPDPRRAKIPEGFPGAKSFDFLRLHYKFMVEAQ
jgi:hypothetical protein